MGIGSDDSSIGVILLAMGLIDQDQLQNALSAQRKEREQHRLGSLLQDMGAVSLDDIELAIKVQEGSRSKKHGERAIAAATVAQQRRKHASRASKRLTERTKEFVRKTMVPGEIHVNDIFPDGVPAKVTGES